MGWTRIAWPMAGVAESVPVARHNVTDLLRQHGWADQPIDDAALMTTELATNAVEHAGTAYTLTVDLKSRGLRVEVHDSAASLPVVNTVPAPDTIGGYGLAIITTLGHRWGYAPDARGKSVWFEIDSERPTSLRSVPTPPPDD